MSVNAKEFYDESVRRLSPKERLRLAAMILQDLTGSPKTMQVDDNWSEQDLQELTAFALSHSENPHEQETENP